MRTTPLKQIFLGVSGLLGAELVTPGSPDHVGMTAAINTWLGFGWEYDFWPEWTPVERRAYRPIWNAGSTYAAGAEVFFEDDEVYYSANSAPNNPAVGESPATAPTKWTEITAFARYVALDQPGLTPIGEVRRICRRDPDVYPNAPDVPFKISKLGIVPGAAAGARVYVEFRKRPPTLSADLYDAATPYAIDDVVFDDDSWECYKALQASTGHAVTEAAYWEKVDFPFLLKRFVERATYADTLRADGAANKADGEMTLAYNFLTAVHDTTFPQQGQQSSASAQTY